MFTYLPSLNPGNTINPLPLAINTLFDTAVNPAIVNVVILLISA